CGIRRYEDDAAMVDNSSPLMTSVFLDQDLSFTVGSEAEARAFHAAGPPPVGPPASPVSHTRPRGERHEAPGGPDVHLTVRSP
ncbi:hypothetical protein, partial [Nocardia carnea]|uniref:hypothetical protein n=1 Tax=Nocardia carnea TaxID=37328 RepID=UPI0024570190